ncbi:MAG: DUF3786 domain-containing protein [Thermodesulfovibrionales bacterium]|nr:DUF3786 domain-containing protein [Thermodesulfovibrionales bacterium]
MSTGEEKAWEDLNSLNLSDVCRKARVFYDRENSYILKSFGMDFSVHPAKRDIKNIQPEGEIILKKYSYFFNISALYYLINAKDIPLSGKLVKPAGLKGGEIFFRGSHVLPLEKIAERYGNDKAGFIEKGKNLNGNIMNYGDASVELLPLPRIPVTLILWLSDDEFPARADLLFDSTCEQRLPLDIIWSIAMMSVLVVL